MTIVSIRQGTGPTLDAIDQIDRLIDLQWALIAAIEVIHREHWAARARISHPL
jgi:hypothetical protein